VQEAMNCGQSYKLNIVCATHILAISQNDMGTDCVTFETKNGFCAANF